ncbi:GlyGly-CTERM sorting domain-containing protein [Vibrio sp. CAIM 722]|uniref:GlyGly-CTERM sorting domain-containing protein n=1 Tax=Vibrio eleionomae TaxID=2653505 RepID=A0A7X4RVD4_9VIBR|nr:GlyGly-CTERM sorting domain-containing protein [Vibrio eleionomae]
MRLTETSSYSGGGGGSLSIRLLGVLFLCLFRHKRRKTA